MLSHSFLCLCWLAVASLVAPSGLMTLPAAAAVPNATVVFTEAPILSGSLDGCAAGMNATTCSGGLAEAAYAARVLEDGATLYPVSTFTGPFVAMHPKAWAVNCDVFPLLNVTAFRSEHSLLQTTQWAAPWDCRASLLISNSVISTGHQWWGRLVSFVVDARTNVAVLHVQDDTQPGVAPVNTVAQVVVHIATRAAVTGVVVVTKRVNTTDLALTLIGKNLSVSAIIDAEKRAAVKTKVGGKIWVLGMAGVVGFNDITAQAVTLVRTAAPNAALDVKDRYVVDDVEVKYHNLLAIPAADRLADATYVAHQTALQSYAAVAKANNPVVGVSTNPLPASVEGGHYWCFAGECPLGDFWTDALRDFNKADVAFTGSGGIRGPGWPQGDVRISNIYDANPYQNQICVATLRGLTLLRIFNFSVTEGEFLAHFTVNGDRLLQVSGVRIVFNTQLPRAQRLVSVHIYDRATGQYLPLDRTRLYAVTTVSWLCQFFSVFPQLLSGTLRGEVGGKLISTITHQAAEKFLRAHNPYTVETPGQRIRNDTQGTTLALIEQTEASCAASEVFDAGLESCLACPAGQVGKRYGTAPPNPFVLADACYAAPAASSGSDSNVLTILIVVVCVAVPALAAVGAAAFFLLRRGAGRDVGNAPRSSPCAIVFTDIESSTFLWAHAPLSMTEAIPKHHLIVRQCIEAVNAYEVKTAGDAFMIACHTPIQAVLLAALIQDTMLRAAWPTGINDLYAALGNDLDPVCDDDPDRCAAYDSKAHGVWHGPRVRVGVHYGDVDVQYDDVTKGYDYYGSCCNTASRVESVTRGGEVCITEPVADALREYVAATPALAMEGSSRLHAQGSIPVGSVNTTSPTRRPKRPAEFFGNAKPTAEHLALLNSISPAPRGDFDMKGIPEPVPVFQALPDAVAYRKFRDLTREGADMTLEFTHSDSMSDAGLLVSPFDEQGTTERWETTSAISGVTGATSVHSDKAGTIAFLRACLRALKQAERRKVVQALRDGWRLPKEASEESVLGTVAKRAALASGFAGHRSPRLEGSGRAGAGGGGPPTLLIPTSLRRASMTSNERSQTVDDSKAPV